MSTNNNLSVDLQLSANAANKIAGEIQAAVDRVTPVIQRVELAASAKSELQRELSGLAQGIRLDGLTIDAGGLDGLAQSFEAAESAALNFASTAGGAIDSIAKKMDGLSGSGSSTTSTNPLDTINSIASSARNIDELIKLINTSSDLNIPKVSGKLICPPCQRTHLRHNGGESPPWGGEPVNCWKALISSPVPKQSGKPHMAAA